MSIIMIIYIVKLNPTKASTQQTWWDAQCQSLLAALPTHWTQSRVPSLCPGKGPPVHCGHAGNVMAQACGWVSCFFLIISIFLIANLVLWGHSFRDQFQIVMCHPIRSPDPYRNAAWEQKFPAAWLYIAKLTSNPSILSGFRNPTVLLSTFLPACPIPTPVPQWSFLNFVS